MYIIADVESGHNVRVLTTNGYVIFRSYTDYIIDNKAFVEVEVVQTVAASNTVEVKLNGITVHVYKNEGNGLDSDNLDINVCDPGPHGRASCFVRKAIEASSGLKFPNVFMINVCDPAFHEAFRVYAMVIKQTNPKMAADIEEALKRESK